MPTENNAMFDRYRFKWSRYFSVNLFSIGEQLFVCFVTMDNIIQPEEYDLCVQHIRAFDVLAIGTGQWLDAHENLLKLNQQAIVEASTCREELIKELLIINDKIEILVHEAYCILVWRTKVLPRLLSIEQNRRSNANFILYTILYHEAMAVSLLEMCLYHENGCAALKDCSMDLIDYCAQAVIQLIGLVHMRHFHEEVDAKALANETTAEEMERQQRDLQYKIGLRCLTILSFMADKIDTLPLSVIRRMVITHDIPYLLSEILHCQPWHRNVNGIEKYIDDKWTAVSGIDVVKVTKIEAHTWFCLRQLLYNRDAMGIYEINEFRQRELSKCQLFLGANVLDQLPPLVDLKHRLCTLALSDGKTKTPIILEEVPQIRANIVSELEKGGGGYGEAARMHAERFFGLSQNEVVAWAQRLNNVYNFDLLEKVAETADQKPAKRNVCGQCGIDAIQKCSNCEQVYYCTRECQVKNWPHHKTICRKKKTQ